MSKVVNSEYIRKELSYIWPACFLFIGDVQYELPKRSEVWNLVVGSFIDKYKYKLEVFDCDDFGAILRAYVKQDRYVRNASYPWPFGEIIGPEFRGIEGYHEVNVCITEDDGVILVEPQNDKIWRPDSADDIATVVWM